MRDNLRAARKAKGLTQQQMAAVRTMSYYRRCPRCGLKWNVSREAYVDPEYKCPACVGRAARPEWRRLSLDDLHAIRRGIEREMRELDAHSERHAGLLAAWQELDELIGTRGGADADI